MTRIRPSNLDLKALKLPLIAAPMFLASGPEMLVASCRAGIIGTLPAHNCRDTESLNAWLEQITNTLGGTAAGSDEIAPYGINLVVHKSNEHLEDQLALIRSYRVPLVITSLGAASRVVEAVHDYGGVVFHDVISRRHAEKAAAAGVDGIVAVAAGAGGHTGTLSPFALLNEIRAVFDGILILSGGMTTGRDIAAARAMGADLAYMGTRFIATQECRADQAYKEMITSAQAADIVMTAEPTGIMANFLKNSLAAAALGKDHSDQDKSLGAELHNASAPDEAIRPWRDIWSAGHGVGSINTIPDIAGLVEQLTDEYHNALNQIGSR